MRREKARCPMAKRNALEELAERLDKGRWNLDVKDYDKAVLIIAELAKVSEGSWVEDCGGKFYLCRLEGRVIETAIGKCRAIADEGEMK